MDSVAGRQVRFGDNGHAESPGETTSRIGGVSAPELDMVEAVHSEPVRFGILADEVFEPDELEQRFSGFFAHYSYWSRVDKREMSASRLIKIK